jgi:hypothetical protein
VRNLVPDLPRPPPQVLRSTAPVFDVPPAVDLPAGTIVRARVPLAHPAPGKTCEVLGTTPAGDIRLKTDTDYVAHARPE